jgi:hypothetical protein
MRVLGCRISDEDGSITIEWYDDEDQSPEGGLMYQTVLTQEAYANWSHVGYYASEILEDLTELVLWAEKYRKGIYKD